MSFESDNPSYECAAYKDQMIDWQIVNDCFIGDRAIKSEGTIYLPQHQKETDGAYTIRLNRSTYWNAYKRTVQGLVGMVFRRNPQLDDDVPPIIAGEKEKQNAGGHIENINLQGSHLDVFAKETFKWAVNDGHSFILVDMPPAVTADNPDASLADERQAGIRPYWVLYRKNQIKNWRSERVNGVMMLTQVSICEYVTEPLGKYGEDEIEQYRVLTPGAWELYRRSENGEWVLYADGQTSLNVIPLAVIYTNETGYLTSTPPLLDLAHENLRHYRLQSDLDNILHYACVPILVEDMGESGTLESLSPDGGKVDRTISPNSLYRVGKGGSLSYVEPDCAGVGKAQEEIEVTKKNMATLGLTVLASKPSINTTATENLLDYEAETSELGGMARNLEDGIEQALRFHAAYLGIGDGGSVGVNRDFTRLALDASMITAFANMVAADELPIETLWSLLEQAELLPPNFNRDEAMKAIEDAIAKRSTYPQLPEASPLQPGAAEPAQAAVGVQ